MCWVQEGDRVQLAWLVLAAAPAVLLVAPPALMLSLHIVQKASTSGAPFLQFGTDVSVALVLGLSITGCLGFLGGLFAVRFQKKIWVRWALLKPCAFSVLLALRTFWNFGHV